MGKANEWCATAVRSRRSLQQAWPGVRFRNSRRMTRFATGMSVLAALACVCLRAQDPKEYSTAYQEGRRMDPAESRKREQKLLKHPDDMLDLTRLIAFYTFSEGVENSEAIAGRRKHLLWLAQERPDSWLWSQRAYGMAIYKTGGRLADPEGFSEIREVWLKHLSAQAVSDKVRDNAASFLQLGDRGTATPPDSGDEKPPLSGDQRRDDSVGCHRAGLRHRRTARGRPEGARDALGTTGHGRVGAVRRPAIHWRRRVLACERWRASLESRLRRLGLLAIGKEPTGASPRPGTHAAGLVLC
jgi:hypothetical protein